MKSFTTAILAIIFFGQTALAAVSAPLTVAILPGEGLREIANHLKDGDLIASAAWFQFLAIFTGRADDLKPGVYVFEKRPGALYALRAIAKGPESARVTIVEGETAREIAEKLSAAGAVFETEDFLKIALPYEGYLFPDTYEFSPGSSPEQVLEILLEHFRVKIASIAPKISAAELGPKNKTLHELVTIASLVEKEVPHSEDRATVVGILKRRLRIGMPLQIDATVVYAVCNGVFRGCPKLNRADYSLESPYNTYANSGLPVGPIGNPGANALYAALAPKNSSYLYYLSDPKTGKTIFSETLDEHNDNRAVYLGL